jgi:hypothetical protein
MRIAILELAINRSRGCDIDHWRAVMRSKDSSPVLRGAVGKVLTLCGWLAGGLLYLTSGSAVEGWGNTPVERPEGAPCPYHNNTR